MNGQHAREGEKTARTTGKGGAHQAAAGTLSALLFAALGVALTDLALQVITAPGALPEPALPYAAHLIAWTLAAVLAHVAPALLLLEWGLRSTRHRGWLVAAAAALFGLSWQATVSSGAGIRAHPLGVWIRLGFALIVPGLLALGAKWLFEQSRRQPLVLRFGAPIAFINGACMLTLLKHYRGFHAHLAVCLVLLLVWVLAQQPLPRWLRRGLVSASLLAVAGFLLTPSQRVALEGRILSRSIAASPLLAELPLARRWLTPRQLVIDLDPARPAPSPPEDAAPAPLPEARARRARNVLLLVLESVRWEYWANPALAPGFHRSRQAGLYFPRAVSVYPATPLAYGAIFTSQAPSVLLATGSWSRERPLDALRFDLRALSKPVEDWFKGSTLTDFFVPAGTPVQTHRSSHEALGRLRQTIESSAGRSFFAWAHLYEPHAPYESHPGHAFGDDREARYRSEVAYLDAEVARFLEWFNARPERDDTLLILVADHGEGLGDETEDGRVEFHSFDVRNVLTAVPLYLQGPALPRDVQELELGVSQLDILPTIFDALGEELPARFLAQGRSLYALLRERPERSLVSEQFQLDGTAFFELVRDSARLAAEARRERFRALSRDPFFASKIALRRGRWKLSYDRLLRRYRLYDVSQDPFERTDLSGSHAAELAQLQERLQSWIAAQTWIIHELGRPPAQNLPLLGGAAEELR